MALYRNIAGFMGEQIGLSLYQPGLTILPAPATSPFSDPVAYQQQQQATQDATATEMNNRYALLMSQTYEQNTSQGFYVDTSDGSIFQWTDAAHTASTAYLPIADIQRIENAAGTAGALLMHMQQPIIAVDTAGLQGGDSSSWLTSQGVDPATQMVSDPVPSVQVLKSDTNTPATSDNSTTTPVTQVLPLAVAPKNNLLPVALVAGLGAVAIVGEPLLKKKRKVVYLGGIALLVYLITQRS